jgi:hypothetical protein
VGLAIGVEKIVMLILNLCSYFMLHTLCCEFAKCVVKPAVFQLCLKIELPYME